MKVERLINISKYTINLVTRLRLWGELRLNPFASSNTYEGNWFRNLGITEEKKQAASLYHMLKLHEADIESVFGNFLTQENRDYRQQLIMEYEEILGSEIVNYLERKHLELGNHKYLPHVGINDQ